MAHYVGSTEGREMIKRDYEFARTLGEQAARAGRPDTANPFKYGFNPETILKAVAWDEGHKSVVEGKRK